MFRPDPRKLRTQSTDAENASWREVRARRLGGFKLRRQVPVGPYVVDFCCFERRLVIELDGGQHADNCRDEARDEWLRERGWRVLRFWNNDVLGNMPGVKEALLAAMNDVPLP